MKTTSVAVMVFFSKVFDHSCVQSSLSTITRHPLTIAFERHLATEGFTDIGIKSAPRHLTYYCMLLFLSSSTSTLFS